MGSTSRRQANRKWFQAISGAGRGGMRPVFRGMQIAVCGCLGLSLLMLVLAACDSRQEGDSERGVTPAAPQVASPVEFGAYHALIIGINDYSLWPKLKFAERDARDIRQILIRKYGFASEQVTFLSGAKATRSKILGALRQKLESLGENDNLLIYYAGHGQFDPLTETGYWIPAEGGLYDESGWISFSNLKTLLTGPGVKAKSVAAVADSCYGGALARSGPTPGHQGPTGADYSRYQQKLVKLAQKRSRQIIASGGYEQVPDRSDFAGLLKQALEENTYPMVDLEYLFFGQVYPKLKFIGQQEPAFARLVSGPDADGQFVLVQTEPAGDTTSSGTAAQTGTTQEPTPSETIAQTGTTQEPTPSETAAQSGKTQEPAPSETIAQTETPTTVHQPETKAVLTVRSNVYDDMVTIDGHARGSTRLDLELEPGLHSVVVEKEGYRPYEQQVELKPGANVIVRAKLEPIEPPVIHFFLADPPEISPGQSTVLRWETQDAALVEIAGIGRVPLSGSRPIEPDHSDDYVLIAQNELGRTVQREVRISVVAEAPSIVSFHADPPEIIKGQPTVLHWETQDAEHVEIAGLGRVELSGSRPIEPDQSVNYVLIAENKQGRTVQSEVWVNVVAEAPRIVFFQASSSSVHPGESATLSWQTENARSVHIEGIGRVELNGEMQIWPVNQTTYTLIAENEQGMSSDRAITVAVSARRPQILSFDAEKRTIQKGESAILSWRVSNSTEVRINDDRVQPSASGSLTVNPHKDHRYILRASNAEGVQVTRSLTIRVVVPAAKIDRFTATSPVTAGSPATLRWRTLGAVRVRISGIGDVSPSGRRQVTPTATTTYTLIASNEKGKETRQSVRVEVNPRKINPGLVVVPSQVMTLAKFMPAPVQLAPAHGSVYHHYPRRTKLSWKPVAGAKHYTVEIEFKSGGKWHPHKKQSGLKTGYTFDFVGAQPGRWRVWAVNSAGKDGLASKWREFRYTK